MFGLYHLLTRVTRTSGAVGALTAVQVHALVGAQLWGVPLSAGVLTGGVLVAVPLLLVAGLATHLTARVSLRRQPSTPLSGISLWVFPWFALGGAVVLGVPMVIAIYWATTNVWPLARTLLLHRVV